MGRERERERACVSVSKMGVRESGVTWGPREGEKLLCLFGFFVFLLTFLFN